MYPQDVKEFTISRLVATIANALATGAPLELKPLYDELELRPSTLAAWHAAAAAVHTLLASEASPAISQPAQIAAHNGHTTKKALAGGGRRQNQTKRSSSKKKSAPVKCEICGRTLKTPGLLGRHMRAKHPDMAPTAPSAG